MIPSGMAFAIPLFFSCSRLRAFLFIGEIPCLCTVYIRYFGITDPREYEKDPHSSECGSFFSLPFSYFPALDLENSSAFVTSAKLYWDIYSPWYSLSRSVLPFK